MKSKTQTSKINVWYSVSCHSFDIWILKFEFVSDWSETDASPDIRISDFLATDLIPTMPV
jgi:hypothetical protein